MSSCDPSSRQLKGPPPLPLTAFLCAACHVEMYLTEKDEAVPKPEEETQAKKKVSQKKLKRQKLKAAMTGGGVD